MGGSKGEIASTTKTTALRKGSGGAGDASECEEDDESGVEMSIVKPLVKAKAVRKKRSMSKPLKGKATKKAKKM
jgi:hypothetical protein